MWGIKIGDEWLDLFPGSVLEKEENNPFLQFNEEIEGEYSYPQDVPASDKNMKLLMWAAIFQKRVPNTGVDASLYDNVIDGVGQQVSVGKVKITKASIDRNTAANGRISIIYLSGISYFWQDIKGKKLRDVDYGGQRQFAWDAFNRNGSGFWGHIHKVVDAPAGYGTYPYCFYPVIREVEWAQGKTDVLNNMEYSGGVNFTKFGTGKDANVIVPFVYLKYVLERIMKHIGWSMDGDILDDEDFKKITVDNEMAIDWCVYVEARLLVLGNVVAPRGVISFDLQNHVPDLTISEFLFALKNRLGLWFDVDKRKRKVHLRELKNIAATGATDYSLQANTRLDKEVLAEPRIFSLKTTAGAAVSTVGYSDQGSVATSNLLPAPTQARDNQVYLVLSENNYYLCQQKEGSTNFVWGILQPNIGNYEPADAKEEIMSAAETVGSEKYSNYLDLIPRTDGSIFWPGRTDDFRSGSLVLLFYHGKQNNKAGQPYPFASHHIYNSQGVQVGNWSLAYVAKKTDGTDVGLYVRQWKSFLDKLTTTELIIIKLYLKLHEYLQLTFDDELIVDGVRMYMKKKKPKHPYAGEVDLECSRI